MRLKDWLTYNTVTQGAFAARVGVRRETVIRWCADENIPDMPKILEIERVTKGKVTADDWAEAHRRRVAAQESAA
jgi:transcriptional regulator with XRE-family HTH domain